MPRHNQPAFVYAIAYPSDARTKIGMACDVDSRLTILRFTEREPRLRIAKQWWCGKLAGSLELIAHYQLRAAKLEGERFAGTTDEIVGYVDRFFDAMPLERVVRYYTEDRERGLLWPTERAFALIERARHAVAPY